MSDSKPYFEMKHIARFSATVWTEKQQQTLGKVLAEAVSQGRGFEVRHDQKGILVLVTPADDFGHVWKIDREGFTHDIGVTEVVL